LEERVINKCVKFYSHFEKIYISRFDLSDFAVVRKATYIFLMSVCPHGTWLQLDGFGEIEYLKIFRKCVEKAEAFLEYGNNKEYFT
jgi:hypothetical protein